MASAPTISREAQQELINRLLSAREQSLLLMHSRGTSLDTIAKLYREYEGPNGVQEAIDAIKEKLERAAQARASVGEPKTLVQKLGATAGLDEEEIDELGEQHEAEERERRVRQAIAAGPSAPNGNMPEPALPAEPAPQESETPPNGAAPASGPSVDACPSPESSTPQEASPARWRGGRGNSARGAVLECIRRDGPITKEAIRIALGISRSGLERHLSALRDQGLIEGRERPMRGVGTKGGSRAKLWTAAEPSAPGQCAHGHAHIDCPLCAPALPGVAPAAEAPEFPPTFAAGTFDARELWESLNPERQKLLARLVFGEVVYPAITKLLLD